MDPKLTIIKNICDALREDHGYEFGPDPDMRFLNRVRSSATLETLRTPRTYSDFRSFFKKETDFGRVVENKDRQQAMLEDLKALSDAGVLPSVTARKDGILMSFVGAMTWGTMSTEEARLLSELRAQGAAVLADHAAPTPDTSVAQMLDTINAEVTRIAHEQGFVVTQKAHATGLENLSVQDTFTLLLVTDPYDGLSDGQEMLTKAQNAGFQGIMRDRCERDNQKDDYASLVALGVLPEISTPEPTGSLLRRMIKSVTNAFADFDVDTKIQLLEMGRQVLREGLENKIVSLDAARTFEKMNVDLY